jgi:hypothetical protein
VVLFFRAKKVLSWSSRISDDHLEILHAERGHQLYPVRAARDVRTCG